MWLVIGFLLSFVQMIPVGMLVHMTYKGLKGTNVRSNREKLTLWLLLSSMFYHVTGASLLGLLITVPWINLYMHGTYITSGHAHLALFGSLGFLVLAGSYFVLSRGSEPTQRGYRSAVLAVILLNLGLLGMSGSLLIAGSMESYLWRFLGMDFMQVRMMLSPYLFMRVLAGGIFTLGDLLLCWRIFQAWRETRLQQPTS